MRKTVVSFASLFVAAVCFGQTFTDVNSPQYHGWQELNAAIDANFALLESGGTIDGSFDSLTADNGLTVQGTVTSISTNGATTNVLVTVNGAIDGEYIANDTIDDDSIDFADVTAADLTWDATVTIPATKDLIAISDNGATTNTVISNGVVDGETIGDDTIDDDSIDFSDVTGADLTLTDCAAVTASGAVYGGTIGFSAATGYFSVINTTQLVFIASSGAATNVIDADITTP